MQGKYIFGGLFVLLCLLASCGKEEGTFIEKDSEKEEDNTEKGEEEVPPAERPYTSYYYYTYAAKEGIDAAGVGLANSDFVPGAVCQLGDTLFITNNKGGAESIILYNVQTKSVINTLRSWMYKEDKQTFPANSKIEDILVFNGKLYVANHESRIDVFNVEDLSFYTRIGTGKWGSNAKQMVNCCSLNAKGEYLYVRAKDRMLIYKEDAILPEKYQNIQYYCRSSTNTFDLNNNFSSIQMIMEEDGIYLTNFGQLAAKQIICLDPELTVKGDNLNLIDEARSIPLDFNPVGLGAHEDRFLIVQNSGVIHIYDRKKEKFVNSFSKIYGANFKKAEKMRMVDNEHFWITDVSANKVYLVEITMNEIREFLPVPETRSNGGAWVKVKGANGKEIVVDVETHEIISEDF